MEKVETGYVMGFHGHEEAGTRHLGAPLLRLDLRKEIKELKGGNNWSERRQNTKTLAKYPDLRVVLIAMKQGVRLLDHRTKGRLSVHILEGHVSLKLEEQRVELASGCLLELAPCVAHDVEAVEESVILLTIAWPAGEE